jgi:hypothetical protein
VFSPGSLKKTAKEDLFKPRLPNGKKEEGNREDLAWRYRSEGLGLGKKKPKQATGAESEQKGEIFMERGKCVEAGGSNEFTHYYIKEGVWECRSPFGTDSVASSIRITLRF